MPKKSNINEFIIKAKKIHENKYDYRDSIYINNKTHMTIICKTHGKFLQTANDHLAGKGCSKCVKTIYNLSSFICKSSEVHLNKYDYSKSIYTSNNIPLIIICPFHGEFNQLPSHHTRGSGCSSCAKNSQNNFENIFISYLKNKKLHLELNYRPKWLDRKELDIYIPSLNLAIECNGSVYHHSSLNVRPFLDNTYKHPKYHLDKYDLCKENGIDLIHIFEFEDLDKWLNNLDMLINDREIIISFENIKRNISISNNLLDFYGKTIFDPQYS